MVERRDGPCFLDESLQSLLICGYVFRQDLDGDGAIQLCVMRHVNVAHSARADL
jgi:hypothetical protein